MSSRDAVLASVRRALGAGMAAPEIPREYRQAGEAPAGEDVVERFCERAADYKASVQRVDAHGLGDALQAACGARGVQRLALSPGAAGFAGELPGLELLTDEPPLPVAELDRVDGVLTGCALAIAETGTIVLDSGPRSGRRALTLVPDYHLCVVEAARVVPDVPDAIAALAAAAAEGRPITFVSGPSATSDIELERVEGVHGPRTLDVLVVG